MSTPIAVRDLCFAYPGQTPIWERLNFKLENGQKVGIWGGNGCGKTTLFSLLMGFLKPQSGQILLNNVLCEKEKQFAGQRGSIGYVFQNSDDQLFCTTVFDEIAFGPLNQGYSPLQSKTIVRETLDLFCLSGYQQKPTFNLSGGEKKIIALAAVWAMRPVALLLDEPTLSLDEQSLAIFKKIIMQSDKAWLMSSHDREFLSSTCDEVWQAKNAGLQALA